MALDTMDYCVLVMNIAWKLGERVWVYTHAYVCFLSCLCGSERHLQCPSDNLSLSIVSKLPTRQGTWTIGAIVQLSLSKLPTRQGTQEEL